ncbi:lipoyl(octanoyl) transferase LipB [Blattabacterium cuenoti]|uniref:lipoyl(octanoyl) transferase LipB n=1 Tax=Blattabacterium cuenoti TaxID=1653831 RepID=UPI00163CFE7F|nr:lipoyl(octanoyl) transferase LipB [Blattabacterium cuenoti]
MEKKRILFEDLGKKEYVTTFNYQKRIFNNIIQKKINKIFYKEAGYLIFVEHNHHIYTIGKNGKKNKHLLVSSDFLKKINATICHTDRGGDITYHGPGQLIIYPILDLDYFFTDIHKYLRLLEEVIIHFLWNNYGIQGIRKKGNTGVWLNHGKLRKICAIGIKISRWVTMHGLALNINTNLQYFNYIIPCGIYENQKVTSLKEELKNFELSLNDVKCRVKKSFKKIFNVEFI